MSTVKSQLETALKYKPPLNSNHGFDVTLKNELETAAEPFYLILSVKKYNFYLQKSTFQYMNSNHP